MRRLGMALINAKLYNRLIRSLKPHPSFPAERLSVVRSVHTSA